MASLKDTFYKSCSCHPFLGDLAVWTLSYTSLASPLLFAICCLASVQARRHESEARNLFMASRGLLGTIMEVDNRESRSSELLLAVSAFSGPF